MGAEAVTLFTVGHSNRSLQELVDLLTEAGVTTLVDVRAQPHSSRHPQFEGEVLRGAAEDAGGSWVAGVRLSPGRRMPHWPRRACVATPTIWLRNPSERRPCS